MNAATHITDTDASADPVGPPSAAAGSTFTTAIELGGTDPVADAAVALPLVRRYEVVRLRLAEQPADLRAYYDVLVEHLGKPIDAAENYEDGKPTGNRWSDIRYKSDVPDDVAFRHSKNAQPLHTDGSYISDPPDVMLFYCVHAAPSGGATIFVSGLDLVADLEANHPELFERLTSERVVYEKAGDRRDRPIIEIDDGGRVDLNFNYYCAEPDQPAAALELNQAFLEYLQNDLPDEIVLDACLRPGEAVSWQDDRVLHGRTAFEATTTDDRLIWKTGIMLDSRDG